MALAHSQSVLVWNHEQGRVFLRPETSISPEPQSSSAEAEKDTTTATTENSNNSSNCIPNTVVQFEQALQRAHNTRKPGKTLVALNVIYSDEYLVVIHKPSGVLTVPGRSVHSETAHSPHNNHHHNLLAAVHARFAPSVVSPDQLVVHRLDMDTSGLVVFGRTPMVAQQLQCQFQQRTVHKEYECLVVGHLTTSAWEIDLPLQKCHETPPYMRVSTVESERQAARVVQDLQQHAKNSNKWKHPAPKPCQTRLRVLEHGYYVPPHTNLPYTRLRLEPVTGRTHQLRVHCAALGFAIVGDPTYGWQGSAVRDGGLSRTIVRNAPSVPPDDTIQEAWKRVHSEPLCLHAALLQITHPVTGEAMRWEVPPDF